MEKLSDITAALLGTELSESEANELIAAIKTRVKASPVSRAEHEAAINHIYEALHADVSRLTDYLGIRYKPNAGNGGGGMFSERLDKIESMAKAALDLAQKLEADRSVTETHSIEGFGAVSRTSYPGPIL